MISKTIFYFKKISPAAYLDNPKSLQAFACTWKSYVNPLPVTRGLPPPSQMIQDKIHLGSVGSSKERRSKYLKQQSSNLLNELYHLSDKFVLKSEADGCIRVVALLFAILQEFPDDIYRM